MNPLYGFYPCIQANFFCRQQMLASKLILQSTSNYDKSSLLMFCGCKLGILFRLEKKNTSWMNIKAKREVRVLSFGALSSCCGVKFTSNT